MDRETQQTVDRRAIDQALTSQYQGLMALLRRKVRDPQLAADLLNDAVELTLKHFDDGRIPDLSHIGGYVYQVALNLLRNHRRQHAERPERRVEIQENTLGATQANESLESSWAQRIRSLIDGMSTDRDRTLLRRFYLNDDDKEDICKDLGISPLHFDKIIFRAKGRARVLFESLGIKKTDFFSFLLPFVAA